MKLSTIVTICLLALFISACGGGNTDKKTTPAPAVTATGTAKVEPSKTPEPTKTPEATGVKAKDPEEFVKAFMKAYQDGNKAETQKYVTEKVMKNNLRFGAGKIEDLNFQGCNTEGGKTSCAYTYGGGSMAIEISGDATKGFQVTNIEETAD